MATVNNWLGFSLSPQDLPPSQTSHTNSTLISGASDDVSGDCFHLSAAASMPALAIPQDWSMKSAELSALVETGGGGGAPKLEDFLGGISFAEQEEHKMIHAAAAHSSYLHGGGYASSSNNGYLFSNSSLQFADSVMVASSVHDSGGGRGAALVGGAPATVNSGSGIGLSMIKSWLRNQPPPQPQSDVSTGLPAASSQGLSLSMNMVPAPAPPNRTASSAALPLLAATGGEESVSGKEKTAGGGGSALDAQTGAMEPAAARKSIDTFGQRTSIYRGVTRHRWTGRYEAHLWDNSCRREGQTRKGRQVYLGGYDKEDKAARAYDLAALKYWGATTTTNFPVNNYEKELEEMKHMTRQEFIASLRRKSSGFSRGASIYRGVTRHHQHGRWQARIGRVAGNKDLYLGTFSTQEEAAEAYDIAAIKFRGLNAVTNFDMSRYDVKSILESTALPIGSAAKRLKEAAASGAHGGSVGVAMPRADDIGRIAAQLGDSGVLAYGAHYSSAAWPTIAFQPPQPAAAPSSLYHPYAQPLRGWCKQEQDAVIAAAHGLQELHHLNLGGGAHDFFSPSQAAMHGLGSIDTASLEHSTGSNSVAYNGSAGSYHGVVGAESTGGCYMMPMGAAVSEQHGHARTPASSSRLREEAEGKQQMAAAGYEHFLVAAEPYGGGGRMAGWMPSSAPAAAASSSDMGACHGAQLFSVWNDT